MRNLWMLTRVSFVACALLLGRPAAAADSPMGTWTKASDLANAKGNLILTIERWGKGGAKLVWRMKGQPIVMAIESALDGKDAPLLVNGQPSGETMGITRIDGHHAATILKFNGKQFGTSTATFSDDFTKMTVENVVQDRTDVGPPPGKTTEIWTRK
jgi:hypothetical protein